MAHSLEIKVTPSSGKSSIVVDKAGVIKCYLKSAPERGAANKELVKMIAKMIGIPQRAVTIVAGATSRKKVLKIECDKDQRAMFEALGLHKQMSMF